jgi:hypothetical protein
MSPFQQTTHGPEWRASANMPPLTRTDLVGIAVAALGTLALIVLAAVTADQDSGSLGALSAARLLIALGAVLINMAHIVGILFFESVDYHGTFQRFFARLSLLGTIGALVVSLALGLIL